MNIQILISLILVVVANTAFPGKKDVVCYIPSWMDITSYVDPSLCTIFVISFGTLDSAGNVGLPDNFASFAKLRTSTSKLVLALGGATAGTWAFEQVSASASLTATFAQNCLNIVQNNGLDGIDIDWEFPAPGEQAQFVALHQALKNALGSNYLVSTAVSAGNWNVANQQIYDIPNLAKACDHINLMTYDYHADASWDTSSGVYFNAPVTVTSGDSVDNGINLWLNGGAPPSKLMVGVPFYGRMYQLSNPSQTAPGSSFNGGFQNSNAAYTPNYNAYCSQITDPTWTKMRDATTLCPYMYNGNLWLSYEDQQSIIDKGNLANKHNLGGVMLWAMHQDDYQGVCSSCKWPLLKALNSAIGRANSCSGSSGTTTTANVPTTTAKGPTTTANVPTTQKATTSSSGTMTSCPSTGVLPNPSDCTTYYNCGSIGAAPYVMPCPAGTFFNKAGYCDYTCSI